MQAECLAKREVKSRRAGPKGRGSGIVRMGCVVDDEVKQKVCRRASEQTAGLAASFTLPMMVMTMLF